MFDVYFVIVCYYCHVEFRSSQITHSIATLKRQVILAGAAVSSEPSAVFLCQRYCESLIHPESITRSEKSQNCGKSLGRWNTEVRYAE